MLEQLFIRNLQDKIDKSKQQNFSLILYDLQPTDTLTPSFDDGLGITCEMVNGSSGIAYAARFSSTPLPLTSSCATMPATPSIARRPLFNSLVRSVSNAFWSEGAKFCYIKNKYRGLLDATSAHCYTTVLNALPRDQNPGLR